MTGACNDYQLMFCSNTLCPPPPMYTNPNLEFSSVAYTLLLTEDHLRFINQQNPKTASSIQSLMHMLIPFNFNEATMVLYCIFVYW